LRVTKKLLPDVGSYELQRSHDIILGTEMNGMHDIMLARNPDPSSEKLILHANN
jgi:hypothetical protein